MYATRSRLLLFLPLLGLMACQDFTPPPTVVTVEPEQSTEYHGWESTAYYTGISMAQDPKSLNLDPYILLEVSIPHPGRYYPWILAARQGNAGGPSPQVRFSASPKESSSVSRLDRAAITLDQRAALQWSHTPADSLTEDYLFFPNPGDYFIRLQADTLPDARLLIDKIVLTNRSTYQPEGYAFQPDTTEIILPPAWAFGILYGGYTNQSESRERVDSIRAFGLPIDGYWIDSWFWDYQNRGAGPAGYIDFRGDRKAYPDPGALWSYLESRQVKAGLWIWDAIQQSGNEAVFADFQDRQYFTGPPYENTDRWHNKAGNTLIADIDFENPEAAAYWKVQLQPFFEVGLDFLKLDRSSEIPFLRAAFTATQEMGRETAGRGFVLSHLHSTYQQAMLQYPTKWTGDAKIAWSQPDYPDFNQYAMGAFRENLLMAADPSRTTYAIPFLTHDAGGYNFYGPRKVDEELYLRWIPFAMMNPVTTVFTSHQNPTANLPWRYSRRALETFRYYARLKMRLFPYIYTYAHRTRASREKMVRGDRRHPDQYRLGEELLVAPVTQPGADSRELVLPPGQWRDFYDPQTVFEGGQTITYPAPLDRLPLLVRSGSILPLRPYAPSIAAGTNDSLSLRIYPGAAAASFTLIEDDGESESYRNGELARTTFTYRRQGRVGQLSCSATAGSFRGMNDQRRLQLEIYESERPERVSINEEPLEWRYDEAAGCLRIDAGLLEKSEEQVVTLRFE